MESTKRADELTAGDTVVERGGGLLEVLSVQAADSGTLLVQFGTFGAGPQPSARLRPGQVVRVFTR